MTCTSLILRSGALFDLADPESGRFTLEDIAHGLSHLCRFTGHATRFYSVAEHAVHCSRIAADGFAFEALMHDAAEAIIGDVARPLKSLLPDYKRIEAAVEARVLGAFGLTLPMSAEVKWADEAMLQLEWREVMGQTSAIEGLPVWEHPTVTIGFWSPEEARRRFLSRFDALSPGAMRAV